MFGHPPNYPPQGHIDPHQTQNVDDMLREFVGRRTAVLDPEISGIPATLDDFPTPNATDLEQADAVDNALGPTRDLLMRMAGTLAMLEQAVAANRSARIPIFEKILLPTTVVTGQGGAGGSFRFDTKGRPYAALWSDSACQVFVRPPGMLGCPIPLQPGWNQVNWPEGSDLQSVGAVALPFLLRASFENMSGAL